MLITDFEYYEESKDYVSQYSGIDHPLRQLSAFAHLKPNGWFENYHIQDFDYKFNSWGFRGPEYDQFIGTPVNICVGDSFTVNLGGPIEHSWSSQLQEYFNIPTLNLGMDGAGNDAIRIVYDRAIKMFDVQHAFVMYSYLHRRLVDNKFTHYNGKKKTGRKPIGPPLHTDEENFSYFEEQYIEDAHEAFLPPWCYKDTELEYIKLYGNFDYPDGGRSEWTNRDYHHMNQDLNKMIAEYFYELSCTDA